MPFKHIHYKLAGFFSPLTEKKDPKVSHESILLVLQWRGLILSRHTRCIII